TDGDKVQKLIKELNPDVVINCAVSDRSIVHIDGEDENRDAIVQGAINIARSCNKAGCRSVFISTDLVFDGKKGDYSESDTPSPIMPYGRYKAEMEKELLALDYNLAIVRTSLIISLDPVGHQVSWIVNSIKNKTELNLFIDEYRSPIFADDLAKAILELAETDFKGLINIAGPEAANRYELGCKIANHFGLDTDLLKPVKAEELNLKRPLKCTLDSARVGNILSTNIRSLNKIFT
ncbi:MAG: SDR family oxidoreductase, partial [Candidatus Dadabacteria bacterium]|nr:SDR family oxidoreductase [Candidatus Dadabacteria bacterium]NIS09875.1 SDR family oxidoreductase [Candidatus Dadabacteria bacterium]NIY21066.1 sugar nucleotide-binding protein [Candidatus Dadabacteria bacterium]